MQVDVRVVQAVVFALAAVFAVGYGLTMDGVEQVAVLVGGAVMFGAAVKVALDVLVRRR